MNSEKVEIQIIVKDIVDTEILDILRKQIVQVIFLLTRLMVIANPKSVNLDSLFTFKNKLSAMVYYARTI